jgi:DnaJ-class molecular chaperone
MNHIEARKILNVTQFSSEEDIKKAYRRSAMLHHPDRTNGNEEKFKAVKAAYEYLSSNTENKQSSYNHYKSKTAEETEAEAKRTWKAWEDEKRTHPSGTKAGNKNRPPIDDLDDLDDGGWMGGGDWNSRYHKNKAETKAETISESTVRITLEEAFSGCFKTTNVKDPGSISNGFINVSISAGLLDGALVFIKPVGKSGQISSGMLKIFMHVESDYAITFTGNNAGDIQRDLEVSPFILMTGGTISAKCIDGKMLDINIPAGLKANRLLRLEGRGYWTNHMCLERGDCYFRIVPKIQTLNEMDHVELMNFIDKALYETGSRDN